MASPKHPEVPTCTQSGILTYGAINALDLAAQIEKCDVETLVQRMIGHIRVCTICQSYQRLIMGDPTATDRDKRLDVAFEDPLSALHSEKIE